MTKCGRVRIIVIQGLAQKPQVSKFSASRIVLALGEDQYFFLARLSEWSSRKAFTHAIDLGCLSTLDSSYHF